MKLRYTKCTFQGIENNYIYNSVGQLVENVDEGVQYEYNASGLVTKVYYNDNLKVQFFYNDKGFRVQKKTYATDGTSVEKSTHYVRDASGSALAIYEDGTQKELPIYGASRLGVYNKPSNTSVYQLTDHLGNVRAVIAKDATGNAAALTHATDYYPFGMPMPNRQLINGEPYRYAYQGQEKDSETGKEAFQLRLWDSRIGRWLTTDPKGEFSSPYLGMGNNPMNLIDPDGGSTACPDCNWFQNLVNFFTGLGGAQDNFTNEIGQTNFTPEEIEQRNQDRLSEGVKGIKTSVAKVPGLLKEDILNIAPDGIEFYASGDGSAGNTKLEGTVMKSYFGDSYNNGPLFVEGTTYGGGLGHGNRSLSTEIGVNYFYSQRPESSMPISDFQGEETTFSFTFGFKKVGISLNYIEGESYWGWGIGLTQKDIGFSIVRTTTKLHFQD